MTRFFVGLAALAYTLTQLPLVGWVLILMVATFAVATLILLWPWVLVVWTVLFVVWAARTIDRNRQRRRRAEMWRQWREGGPLL